MVFRCLREFVGIPTAVQPIEVHWYSCTVTVGHILTTEGFSQVLLIVIVLDAEIFHEYKHQFHIENLTFTVVNLMCYKFNQLFHMRYTFMEFIQFALVPPCFLLFC